MSEWREVSLGEVVERAGGFIKTGPFGSQLHAEEYTTDPDGVPVIMPKDMVSGRVARESVSRVDQTVAERLRAHRLAPGDLVLARRGDLGRFAFIEDDEGGWLCGTGAMRVHAPDEEVICPRFLRYAMARPRVADWLMGQAVGATMPNLNGAIVAEIPLRVPEPRTQRRVSAVLAAFDELIEINERRIELLEDVARSLYHEWFVRFRSGGAGYGFSRRRLPSGWYAKSIGDLCLAVRGRSYRKAELSAVEGVPFLTLKSVAPGGGFRPGGLKRYTGRYNESQRVQAGETLVAVTDMAQERRIVAQAFRMPTLDEPFAVPSLDLVVVRPKSAGLRTYLHAVLRYSDFAARLRHFANGANVLHLAVERILEAPIIVPDERTVKAFSSHLESLFSDCERVERANRALARTRDLLLPRLVTGWLNISDLDLNGLLQEEGGE